MRIKPFKCIPVVMLMLGGATTGSWVQASPGIADQLQASAVDSFRRARFSEAYGRFIALADAGHAPAAHMALWMYLNGPTLFDKDWDSTQDQLNAWAHLARQPMPLLEGRAYPQRHVKAAKLVR